MELGVTMHALSFLVYVVNVLSKKKTCGNFYKIVQFQKNTIYSLLFNSGTKQFSGGVGVPPLAYGGRA